MNLNLIPQPQKLNITDESLFALPDWSRIYLAAPESDSRLRFHAENLLGPVCLTDSTSCYSLCSEHKPALNAGCSGRTDSYALDLDSHGFCITADTAAGLFYGIQTLKQLLSHQQLPSLSIEDWADIPMRADYLDLRNIFPPFKRILYFIKELSCYKINTLVIEYEDKLPFQTMNFMRHTTDCFTEEEFSLLLSTAREYFIEIIPLQQSFGHLEYALKYPEYIHLREMPEPPGEMCPLRPGSLELSKILLSDTASLHPDSRYLHIGCDEVWSLGTSEECRKSGKTRERIFIEFVNHIISHVCALGKTPIIWHDMFAHATQEEIALLDKRVLVAIWLYSGSDMPFHAKGLMSKLEQEGISYIGGSSVRCWDNQPEQNYPNIDNRLLNLDLWGGLAEEMPVKGLIHTNWASSFSFGRPYGLFETSRYPLIYAADISWNHTAVRSNFLYRFLYLYHGLDTSILEPKGYRNRDYYLLMHSQYQNVSKNYETAYLIHLMIALETSFPVQHTIFRYELYPDSEVEYSCLKERSLVALQKIDAVEKQLAAFIPDVLNESMGRLFLESRLYLYRMAKERLLTILEPV